MSLHFPCSGKETELALRVRNPSVNAPYLKGHLHTNRKAQSLLNPYLPLAPRCEQAGGLNPRKDANTNAVGIPFPTSISSVSTPKQRGKKTRTVKPLPDRYKEFNPGSLHLYHTVPGFSQGETPKKGPGHGKGNTRKSPFQDFKKKPFSTTIIPDLRTGINVTVETPNYIWKKRREKEVGKPFLKPGRPL